MKLLIVDDEELTRTGVISSVDWKSIGISEVIQADDGVHGLDAAGCIDLKSFSVTCVCRGWMGSLCWKEWKSSFRIPCRSS